MTVKKTAVPHRYRNKYLREGSQISTISTASSGGGGESGGRGGIGVTITGTGNAVTNAEYNSASSLLNLTMGNVQPVISDLSTIRSNASAGKSAYDTIQSNQWLLKSGGTITGELTLKSVLCMEGSGVKTKMFNYTDGACHLQVGDATTWTDYTAKKTLCISGANDQRLGLLRVMTDKSLFYGKVGIGAEPSEHALNIAGSAYMSGNLTAGGNLGVNGNASINGIASLGNNVYFTNSGETVLTRYSDYAQGGIGVVFKEANDGGKYIGLHDWSSGGVWYYNQSDSSNFHINRNLILDNQNSLKIGNAYLQWNVTNNALKVTGANGAQVNIYATGGVAAYSALNSFDTLSDLTLTNSLTVGKTLTLGDVKLAKIKRTYDENEYNFLQIVGSGTFGMAIGINPNRSNKDYALLAHSALFNMLYSPIVGIGDNSITEVSASGNYIFMTINGTRYRLTATQV